MTMKKPYYFVLSLMFFSIIAGISYYQNHLATGNRKIASASYSENDISSEAKKFTDEMIAIKTPDQISSFIEKNIAILETHRAQKSLTQLPEDYRFLASFLYPIKDMRGMGHRVLGFGNKSGGLFEKSSIGSGAYNRTVINGMIVSQLQDLSSYLETYSPGAGKNFFNWLTVPTEGQKADIAYSHDLQNFAISSVYFNLQKSLEVLESITHVTANSPLTIDSTILTGTKYSLPVEKRFLTIFPHELMTIKGLGHLYSHNIILYAQYNRDDYLNYTMSKGQKIGNPLSAFFSTSGLPINDQVQGYSKYPNLYKMRTIPFKSSGTTWMTSALTHLKNYVAYENKLLPSMRTTSAELSSDEARHSLINPKLESIFQARTNKALKKRTELLSRSNVQLNNWLTGDIISVSATKFYTNPPADLKAFLPTVCNTNVPKRYKNKDGEVYTNYEYGLPTSWNLAAWKQYFPSVNTQDDIRKVARALKNSPSTNIFSGVITSFISM